MNVFDNMRDKLLSYFTTNDEVSSDWIKINDKRTTCGWTIEDFPHNIGVDENITDPHCWKCVSVNQCWFKNEDNKKPEHFDYSKYTFAQIPKSKRGLYHPNCHCKERAINVPKEKEIQFIVDEGKIESFFELKSDWFYSWGYKNSDKNEFIQILHDLVLKQYRYGNYEKEKHTRFGYQINVPISIPGKNEKLGKFYNLKSAYMVFPNGKLRLITVAGGKNNAIF